MISRLPEDVTNFIILPTCRLFPQSSIKCLLCHKKYYVNFFGLLSWPTLLSHPNNLNPLLYQPTQSLQILAFDATLLSQTTPTYTRQLHTIFSLLSYADVTSQTPKPTQHILSTLIFQINNQVVAVLSPVLTNLIQVILSYVIHHG